MTDAPDAPEVIEVDTDVVHCDGGGALAHPRDWLNMAGQGGIDCPYCDCRFVLKQGGTKTAGH